MRPAEDHPTTAPPPPDPVPVDLRLLREQLRPVAAMLGGGAWSVLPAAVRSRLDPPDQPVVQVVRTGSDALLDATAAWAGTPPGDADGVVPPHTACRWAMPVIARCTAKAPVGLLGVLNQGVRVRAHAPIPRHRPLRVTGRLADVAREPGRVRITSAVEVAVADDAAGSRGARLLSLDVHAVVPTGGPRPSRRGGDGDHGDGAWEAVGSFAADRRDGKRFFALTGDPHPLHTVEAFGRRTRFGGCILHGFGTLARTWGALRRGGLPVTDLDVRFVAPLALPSPQVVVERRADPAADGRHAVRARGVDGTVHLAGWLA